MSGTELQLPAERQSNDATEGWQERPVEHEALTREMAEERGRVG